MKAVLLFLALAAAPGFAAQDIPMMGGLDPFNMQPGAGLADVISGKVTPLQRTLKDFDESWRRFTVQGGGDSQAGYLTLMMGAMGSGLAGPSPYYTRGEVVPVGTETYLIAYRQQTKGPDLPTLMMADRTGKQPPRPEALSVDTPLLLSLLSLRTLGSLNDIRPVVAAQEVEESKAAIAKTWDALTETISPPRPEPVVKSEPAKPAVKPAPKTAPRK